MNSIAIKNLLAIITFVIVLGIAVANAEGASRIATMQARAKPIICKVFGPYCQQALRVAWCESRHYKWAVNGQYRGLFQMGAWERDTYGHAPGAWAQARAALRYFRASGHDWSPWTCKP